MIDSDEPHNHLDVYILWTKTYIEDGMKKVIFEHEYCTYLAIYSHSERKDLKGVSIGP